MLILGTCLGDRTGVVGAEQTDDPLLVPVTLVFDCRVHDGDIAARKGGAPLEKEVRQAIVERLPVERYDLGVLHGRDNPPG